MNSPLLSLRRLCRLIALAVVLPAVGPAGLPAQSITGTIEGRVSNPATGDFIEGARLSVEGTALETATDADGNYRLTDVPAGAARVRVFYTGLPVQTDTVTVAAGQIVQHDIRLAALAARPAPDGTIVKLDEFVVSTSREMSAAALAVKHPRSKLRGIL